MALALNALLDLPKSEREARDRLDQIRLGLLKNIIRRAGVADDDGATTRRLHASALAIMTAFPNLATEPVNEGRSMSPLYWFLITNAEQDHIADLHALYPEAVTWFKGRCFREACRREDDATALFLLGKYPEALTNHCNSQLPFIFSLFTMQYTTAERLQAFMQLNPKCHGCRDRSRSDGYYPISAAMKHRYGNAILTFMADNFPKDIDHLMISDCTMGKAQADALVRLLPQLKTLELLGLRWTVEGMTSFASALHSDAAAVAKLENVELCFPEQPTEEETELLAAGLSKNSSISSLILSFNDGSTHDKCFGILSAGIGNMKKLERLCLCDFRFAENNALLQFIANGGAPKSLHIRDTRHHDDSWTIDAETWARCRVEHLEIDWENSTQSTCSLLCRQNMLDQIVPKIPLLKALVLRHYARHYPAGIDATASLVAMLKKESLVTFEASYVAVDCKRLCEALKHNSSLRAYRVSNSLTDHQRPLIAEVLAMHNTTLESVHVRKMEKGPSLEYWTSLNKFGRKKARDPDTSRAEFSQLLFAANVARSTDIKVQFGLLRELPGLWCLWPTTTTEGSSNARPKKRKRSETDEAAMEM